MYEYHHEDYAPASEPKPLGIGGWLILPALGLLVGPILIALSLIVFFDDMAIASEIGYGPAHASNIIVEATLLGLMIYAATRFFGKKRNAPAVMIALYAFNVLALILLLIIETLTGAEHYAEASIQGLYRSVPAAIVWISYFQVSERVKATFVR